MAVLQTYGTTAGNREDILDLIQQVSPEETPLFSRLKDSVANATVHVWVEETLTTGTSNAAVEGATVTGSTSSSKARKQNYTQIITKDGAVSGTQQRVSNVGGEEEYAHEMRKKMKEWKLDCEYQLIHSTSAAGNASTARSMAGLVTSITTNRVTGSAKTIALTESTFNDLLQTIFEAGAMGPYIVAVAGFNKRRISQFATSNTRQLQMAGSKTLSNTVSVYESDFGTVEVVLDRYVTKGEGILMDESKFRKAWLRKPATYPLAKRGDLDEFQIVGEFTLEHLNERAGGILSAFATATS